MLPSSIDSYSSRTMVSDTHLNVLCETDFCSVVQDAIMSIDSGIFKDVVLYHRAKYAVCEEGVT